MTKEKDGSKKRQIDEGYTPSKKDYKPKPGSGGVTGGYKPEKSELKPTNPPKKK